VRLKAAVTNRNANPREMVAQGYESVEELNRDTEAMERLGLLDIGERRPNLSLYDDNRSIFARMAS
jgi:hypothetical protein